MSVLKPEKKRFRHPVPVELIDLVNELSYKHIPMPSKASFFTYIIKGGMEAVENGNQVLDLNLYKYPRKPQKPFPHFIDDILIYKFARLWERQDPLPKKKEFLIHIVVLGIEAYRKDYSEFGIRKVVD